MNWKVTRKKKVLFNLTYAKEQCCRTTYIKTNKWVWNSVLNYVIDNLDFLSTFAMWILNKNGNENRLNSEEVSGKIVDVKKACYMINKIYVHVTKPVLISAVRQSLHEFCILVWILKIFVKVLLCSILSTWFFKLKKKGYILPISSEDISRNIVDTLKTILHNKLNFSLMEVFINWENVHINALWKWQCMCKFS